MDIKIKRSKALKTIPGYAKQGDAGIDLTAVEILSDTVNQITYGTGLSIEIPEGYVGLVYPRSSIRNKSLLLSNSVGVIDSGYRGEIQATFNKTNSVHSNDSVYAVGDRICQIIIVPYPKVNLIPVQSLSESIRGIKGFGSTGE